MRLAILQQSYGRFGGAERLVFSHYLQLKRMNVDVTLYYGGVKSVGWTQQFQGNEIRAIPYGIPRNSAELAELHRFVREMSGFDKILIHHHVEPVLAFRLTRLSKENLVWYSGSVLEAAWEASITGHDYRSISQTVRSTCTEFYGKFLSSVMLSNPVFGLAVGVGRAIDVATARKFGKVIANSFFLSKFLQKAYRLREAPGVVYPGPDPILQRLSSQRMGEERDFILAVGSLIPLKNFDGVIRVVAEIPQTKLIIVGDGQERVGLEKLASGLNVPLEIRGGFLDETQLARTYSECMFLVHLSLYEPFGLTPVEAGLFSKPAIVTNRGGPPEVVSDGETGYVVNPRDFTTTHSRISQLLMDTSLRNEMGRKARLKMTRCFNLERSASSLMSELED